MPRTCSGYADIEPIWPQDRGSPGQIYGHGVDLDQLHGRPGVATSAITYDKGPCRVRKNVLVVAGRVELRARIARVLHSAGYSAELADNPKRALELAARKDIQAAIVVQSRDLAGLGQELRDKIPTTILLGERTDDIVRPGYSLQGTDAEDALDEQKLLDLLSRPEASPGSTGDETVPAPVKIGDCKLDLAGHTFVDGSGREVRLTRAET